MKMMRHLKADQPTDSIRSFNGWSPILGFALSALLAAASFGCKKKEESAQNATPEQPATPPPTELTAKWPVGKRLVRHVEFTSEVSTHTEGTVMTPAAPATRSKRGQAPAGREKMRNISQSGGATTERTQEVALNVVKAREGGGVEIEAEILAQSLESNAAGRTLATFDSKADPKTDRTNLVAGPLRKLMANKIKLLTDPSGKVDSVEGLPELTKKVTAGASAQAQALTRALLSESALKELAPMAFGLPNKGVAPGESWAWPMEIPFATVTFKDLEDHDGKKLALLEYTGSVTNVANGQSGAVTIEVEKSSLSGQLWYDPSLGLNVEQTTDSQITMKISSARGSTTSDSTQKSTSKLVEIGDIGKDDSKAGAGKSPPVAKQP
jgi:hypothetical protein